MDGEKMIFEEYAEEVESEGLYEDYDYNYRAVFGWKDYSEGKINWDDFLDKIKDRMKNERIQSR